VLSGGCPSDDQSVTWSSGTPAVATVDATGTVTAVSAGTANITATAFDNTTRTTIIVLVRARTPTVIDARPDVDTLSPLGTRALSATVRDQEGATIANAVIVWRSLTPALATITAAGVVSAVASGTASIEAATARSTATDSLRDTVRILIVPSCSLIRRVQLGTTISGSFDASTCQDLYGFRLVNQYSVTSLTQAYYSVRVTPTVTTALVPLNLGSAFFGLPAAASASTGLVVMRPGTFGLLVTAPATSPGSYTLATTIDPDPKLLCVPTDVTTGVAFRTGVTPTCASRDIRILPALTAGQNLRATATATSYPVTIELRNATTNALLQRSVATAAGATATINYRNPAGTPLVLVRILGGTTVDDYVNVSVLP